MHWHWQNLNEKRDGRVGSGFVNGRAWLHFAGGRHVGVQWVWSRPLRIGVHVERGNRWSEREAAVTLYVGFFALYWHAVGLAPSWWVVPGYEGRDYELSFTTEEARIRWKWHAPSMSWSSRQPKWMDRSWSLADVLLGSRRYESTTLGSEAVAIPMPERSYPATVKMERATWRRSRWPFPLVLLRAHVDIPDGVPVPGKGENSWDCGDDALYGLTTPADSVEDAIAKTVAFSLTTRRKYGGRNWTAA